MPSSLKSRLCVAALAAACWGGAAAAALTPIYTIQGSGATSPLVGQTVSTRGVVTLLTSNGFFLQDLTGDANPATSDGIFVFTSAAPTVQVGQWLELTGEVTEFNTGAASNADTAAHPVTELTRVSGIVVLGSGYSVAPVVLNLPEAVNDELERVEGMLVHIPGPLTVGQNYFQARYGQLTLSVGGRLETPTNRFRPGPQAVAMAGDNARRRLLLDDGSSRQNPNPTPYLGPGGLGRAGDTVASLTGVIDYGLATSSNAGFGDYKLHPSVAPVFSATHPRPARPPEVGGNLRLAAFNVLNYFTTFTDGRDAFGGSGKTCTQGADTPAASLCRGASNAAEFGRQRSKIIEAMLSLDADAIGLMEVQNNGGVAVQNLVDGLNARAGAGRYAAVPNPAGGVGSDAIQVALIYQPARLSRVGAPASDLAAVHNRPPLAQTFAAANGERLTLVVNHFKSKGSCPSAGDADAPGNVDSGDGQGCWNALRVQQAQALRSFVARLQADSGSPHVLVTGDLNAYAQEDPVFQFTSSGYVDAISRFQDFGYSYVFDGAAGRLDHALSTPSLAALLTGAALWHINADESLSYDYNLEFKQPACAGCAPDPYAPDAYRSSDHDPVLLGLDLYRRVDGGAGRDSLQGTAGDDMLTGGPGADRLHGGAGRDLFRYLSMRDAGDEVNDFTPGEDRIDLRPLLAALGYTGVDAVAEGWVAWVAVPQGTRVTVAPGGPGQAMRPLLTLLGVAPASLVAARDLLVR